MAEMSKREFAAQVQRLVAQVLQQLQQRGYHWGSMRVH